MNGSDSRTKTVRTCTSILLVLYACMGILFGGMWVITGAYLESYLAVWSVSNTGPYLIVNSLLSLIGAIFIGTNQWKSKVGSVLLLLLPSVLVLFDLIDIFGRLQANTEEGGSQFLTTLLFPPLFFHAYMIYLSVRIRESIQIEIG